MQLTRQVTRQVKTREPSHRTQGEEGEEKACNFSLDTLHHETSDSVVHVEANLSSSALNTIVTILTIGNFLSEQPILVNDISPTISTSGEITDNWSDVFDRQSNLLHRITFTNCNSWWIT